MAAPILGIEYGRDSVKIVEAHYARRIKILNFAVLDLAATPQDRRAEQIQHTLKTRGFEARQAIVAFGGPGTEHKLLSLPPLSSKELRFVMAREAKKAAGSKDMLWTYDTLEAKEEAGVKKTQILLVTADAGVVRTIQDGLAPAQLKFAQLTTVAESLVNLLKSSGVSKKNSTRCLAHFSGNRGHVVFVRNNVLLASRDIQFDYADTAHDEQIARLVTEIKRSGLFFRQNFPQSHVEEYLFSGDNKLLGALAAATQSEFGVEAGLLNFDDVIDTSGLRGDWDTLRFNLPALAAAIGAAWRKKPGEGVNLLPNTRPAPQRIVVAARAARFAGPAALALMLLTGSYYYTEQSRLKAREEKLQNDQRELQGTIDRAAATVAERDLAKARLALLERLAPKDWIDILRNLSFLVPSTAVFEDVRVEPGAKPSLVIRGAVTAPTVAAATTDFNKFFNALRQLPKVSPPTLIEQKFGRGEDGLSRVAFEVRCELN